MFMLGSSRGQYRVELGVVAACVVLQVLVAAAQKGASVTLRARWNGTSYLSEAAEFLADENPSLYWKYVDLVLDGEEQEDSQQCWSSIVSTASSLLTGDISKVLPLVLGSRQYSARLEMYRQLRAQFFPKEASCCLVDVGGKVASTAADLKELLTASYKDSHGKGHTSQLFAFDHVYGERSKEAVVAVLYGPLGAPCMRELHTALRKEVEERKAAGGAPLVYAHRPWLGPECQVSACVRLGTEQQVALPAYGVEAVLKNMEYSAMDDKKVAAEEGKNAGKGDGDLGELKGFNFERLLARKPELRQELLTFRDNLASSDEEETLKLWDLKDIGLQAAQRVMSASDPLALLTEISQNFPSLVSSLSRQKVDDALRKAVAANQQYVSPGANFMLLNGLAFDINSFDYYALMDRLRIEARLQHLLTETLNLTSAAAQQLLSLRAEDSGQEGLSEARLDLGALSPHVTFLNDLEKDKMYARFSGQLTDIINAFPGRLRPLALNLFTLVVFVDPSSTQGLLLGDMVYRMFTEYYPIRFGIVPIVPDIIKRAAAQRTGQAVPPAATSWAEMSQAERFSRALLTLKTAYGGQTACSFWATLGPLLETGVKFDDESFSSQMKTAFMDNWALGAKSPATAKAKQAAKKSGEQAWKQLQEGAGHSAEVGMELQELSAWVVSKGLGSAAEVPMVWLNGMLVPIPEVVAGTTDQEISYRVLMENQRVQEAVYFGRMREGDGDLLSQILAQHSAITRFNPSIMGSGEEGKAAKTLPLGALLTHAAYPALKSLSFYAKPAASSANEPDLKPHAATHYVVADLAGATGRVLLQQAMRFVSELSRVSRDSRVVVVPNPTDPSTPPSLLELVLHAAGGLQCAQRQQVAAFLMAVAGDSSTPALLAPAPDKLGKAELDAVKAHASKAGLDDKAVEAALTKLDRQACAKVRTDLAALARQVFKQQPGDNAVITNGRLQQVSSATSAETLEFLAEDFQLLQLLAVKYQPGGAVAKEVGSLADSESLLASGRAGSQQMQVLDDIVTVAVAELMSQKYPESRLSPATSKQLQQVMGILKGKAVEVGTAKPRKGSGKGPTSSLHIVAILNPLTRAAQRISQVLQLLRSSLGASMSLYLNPQTELSDLPLKAFYRYALPEFTEAGNTTAAAPSTPTATFNRLPAKRVLTLNLDVPEAWLVEPAQALYDLDNLRLADIPDRVAYAEFELEAVMLTGSCVDNTRSKKRGSSTRGVQLHLGTSTEPHVVDTLVMSNLAYFQLKAAPGMWSLSLAPGRTQQVYDLESSTGISEEEQEQAAGQEGAAASTTSTRVIISSLSGKQMILRLRKKPGMEGEDVLAAAGEVQADEGEEDEDDEGLWDSLFGGGGEAKDRKRGKKEEKGAVMPVRGSEQDVINVFTVASGHMYERLQKIMILSVIKSTQSRVKFWIIKNYMSPHHKVVIPAMARKYGFDYEFVTYKWPHWLHKQTEKQRIIWAYKILFLDVLFPLNVDRIIFVDSDQVVRADLAELYHMDIEGAPYAYTPFCDNNKEMDEFRFWKGGFWKDHLRGLPYHISALYLVDLKRFRALAAGDRLRIVYEQLSKDPNSLANLDQDLPNYVQHDLRIFSLPQQWLWCESWCGNATKSAAKTIDLCNNPKTKEPKLTAARRIIAEWNSLDEEQGNFTSTVDMSTVGADLEDEEAGAAGLAAGCEKSSSEEASCAAGAAGSSGHDEL